MSYQKTIGALCANSHPGSYTGQDAYNDMLITDESILRRKRTAASGAFTGTDGNSELYARSADTAVRERERDVI